MKKMAILSSILSIVLCLSLIVGGTYALFTSESETNIAITSGTVDVFANIDESKIVVYSPKLIDQVDGKVIDDENVANGLTFFNGGSVAYDSDKATLNITNITPGDKVHFNIDVKNNSNVIIQYRVEISDVSGGNLNGLVFNINNVEYKGSAVNSDWKIVQAEGNIDSIPVSVVFPSEADNDYQGLTTELSVKVVAVQGNTIVKNDLKTVIDDITLTEAINAKQDYTIGEGEFVKTVIADGVTVTIDGGNFKNQVIAAKNGGTVIVNDANTLSTQTGNGSYTTPNVLANVNSGAKVVINGGSYEVGTVIMGDGTGIVEITGGYFDGMMLYSAFWGNPFASLTITGGTFSSGLFVFGDDIAQFVPDTHTIINNADGSCTVVAK